MRDAELVLAAARFAYQSCPTTHLLAIGDKMALVDLLLAGAASATKAVEKTVIAKINSAANTLRLTENLIPTPYSLDIKAWAAI
jgi:hypothetical protein